MDDSIMFIRSFRKSVVLDFVVLMSGSLN